MLSKIIQRFLRRPKVAPIPEFKYHVTYWVDGVFAGATMTTCPIPMVEDDLRAFRRLLQMDHGTENVIITSWQPLRG